MINCTHHQWFWLLAKGKDILEQKHRTKAETMRQRRKLYRLFMMNDLMGSLS